jgi:hypothetical protein
MLSEAPQQVARELFIKECRRYIEFGEVSYSMFDFMDDKR